MRISDWSSDGCSSDLSGRHPDDVGGGAGHPQDLRSACQLLYHQARRPGQVRRHREGAGGVLAVDRETAQQDRTSVVKGKSVSVRVDLGGRRIIKKQILTNKKK